MTRRAAAALAALALFVAGCSPLQLLDWASPKADYVVMDAAYGPDPRHVLSLYRPKARSGPAPVVVFFYGGGWEAGDRRNYAFAASALIEHGFVVAIADYRVYPPVGFPGFLEDSARAVAWVRDHAAAHGGDPARLFLMGHSAGAYNAVMLSLDTRYLQAVGVPPAAISGVAGFAGPYDFLPLSSQILKTIFAAPDLAATQPITYARSDAPPMLLATGDADDTVLPRNTRNLARRQRELGARAETIEYPGLGHAGIVSALSPLFRWRAPVLADAVRFVRSIAGEDPT